MVSMTALVALTLVSKAPAAAAFAGVWKGRLLDQPAVELRLAARRAPISGTAIFYVISPGTGPGPKVETPLLEARLSAGVLSFGVRREDKGITRMEMRLVSATEAELKTLAASLDPEHAPPTARDPTLTLKKEGPGT
jgi:hypothetical protein